MQSTIDSIITQLQSLLENVKNMESKYLSEILSLQKIINHTLKCIPYIPPKENKKQIEKGNIEISHISVEEKFNAMMNELEMRKQLIQSQKIDLKHKFQVKPPEIIIQKKPPLPTGNRNQKAIKNFTPAYVPPRNKNEVTGKVTQNTIKTPTQKVFKPQRTSLKKNQFKQQIKTKQRSVQKKTEKKIESVPKKQISKEINKSQKPIHFPPIQQNIITPQKIDVKKVEEVKIQKKQQHQRQLNKSKMVNFDKQIQEIISQLIGQGPKNHKKQIQKLINECENQQKGHRMNQQNNRKLFIRKSYNYALSRHNAYPMSSFQLSRKKWQFHNELQNLHLLLDNLSNQLTDLSSQKDCRIDKKTQFRIINSHLIYRKTIEQIRDDTENSKSQVPQKLQLTFNFIQQPKQIIQDETIQLQQLTQLNLNDQLLQLLQQIGNKGNLQKNELRGLQVLSQVGIFRSKRSPLIVMEKQYKSWKNHYSLESSY